MSGHMPTLLPGPMPDPGPMPCRISCPKSGPMPCPMPCPMPAPGPGPGPGPGPSPDLPGRFQQPSFYRGYRQPTPHPRYRTTNQTYGSRAPTVYELPSCFHVISHKFTDTLGPTGMYRNDSLNTSMETSYVTGPDTFITAYEHHDFHPSYNPSGPSHCRDLG